MKLFSKLNEEYFYSGEEFEDDLLKSKAWEAEKTGRNKYRVFPHVSVGTLFINHIPIPIKVNVELIESESGSESVLLSTNIRSEHYFIFVLFASACTIIPLAFKKDAWVVIYPLVLWFPFHAFSNLSFEYRKKCWLITLQKN